MNWVEKVKELIPDYAKDIRLNLENVILRSSLEPAVANGCALAAAIAAGGTYLSSLIDDAMVENYQSEANAAKTAASLMAMTNTWYPYVEMTGDEALKMLPAQLRMNAIVTHGGVGKQDFEAFSLAASIVGKCHFCVRAHYDTLKKEGFGAEQLRDVGRIAAVIAAVVKTTK